MTLRLAAFAALVAAPLLLEPAPASAETPRGNLGLVVGGRQNIGSLADDYRLGVSWGVRAGYHLMSEARPWSVGGDWSVVWSRFGATSDTVVASPLSVLEMNFGLGARFLLSETAAHFATVTVGGTLYRANNPLPPDDERTHAGPYAGVGTDVFLTDEHLLSVEARYGLLSGGPRSLLLLAGISFGR